jgi:hypothetical protein
MIDRTTFTIFHFETDIDLGQLNALNVLVELGAARATSCRRAARPRC